jgi:hypothetical protein
MTNKDIRVTIAASGFPKWKIAQVIGIADTTFSKWLRRELPSERKALITAAVQQLMEKERGA